jgi:hypothetical protein
MEVRRIMSSKRTTVKEQREAVEEQGKVVSHKRIDNNTTEFTMENGDVVVRLHNTNIVTLTKDDSIILNSGGWRTVTTRDRISKLIRKAGWSLYSERGVWIVSIAGKSYTFTDGMIIHADGSVEGAGDADLTRKLRESIRDYARDYMSALMDGKIGPVGPGDCWGCVMVSDKGEHPLGGRDHLLSHIEEKYYVPSLVWNAMAARGMGDYWKAIVHDLQSGNRCDSRITAFFAKDVGRCIARFMYREIGC